ncbi:tripartite tricarboxylate transporter substrate binding protein [Sphaerochaeta sp. PS]|uniref:tripartite tricarboxylate transporter substrate binding protein n=1 Tax=Sphaerochaeta sp. PS TaxID=3076336 RepID=UPI0028A3568D|nr:tripartite tricarboxylate transporter substrate binding protein [Sphaerochaeta sp. PS]MDT4761438.1 tripartite tricarboxylate transporter substrate binding protein [Sphaerochaeta sp. PS]
MKKSLALTVVLFALATVLMASGMAEPQNEAIYPKRAITMIVPYGAGGTTDLSGRQLAIQMEKHLGKSITVINQGGASGSIGARTVLDAKPDGYTILFTAESLGTQRVMGLSDMSYADFTPIMVVVNDPKVIVVNKNSPYKSLADLVADIKARPGKVKMSYTGPGGSGHVQSLIYNKLGMQMALTAYPGGSDCILAVLGNQVDFTNSNFSTVTGYLENGDLRLLGISEQNRLASYPDVPTLAEVVSGSEVYLSNPFTPLSLLVDKDVPQEIVAILKDAAQKSVQEEGWKAFVASNSLDKLYEKYPTEEKMRTFFKDWESLVSWMLYDSGAAKISPEKFGISKLTY